MVAITKEVFDINDVPEDEGFKPLPEGEYTAQIVQSEMKENRAKTGQYLELRVQILDEPYTGRLIFERLNLINPNEMAVKIAKRTLDQICKAVGVEDLEDSEELHGIEMTVDLKINENEGTDYPPNNEVKKYLPL